MLVLAACLVGASSKIEASQEPEPPIPIDTTPLDDLLTPEEKLEVNKKANDPRKEVEAYLHISDNHLDLALSTIKRSDYRSSERELDIYKKALSRAGDLAFALPNKRRSVAKKMEQFIYKQIRTLESVQRLFPADRLAFAEAALSHAKQLRVQALNAAFAAGEVLKEPDKQRKPAGDEPPQARQLQQRLAPAYLHTTIAALSVEPRRHANPGPLVQSSRDYLTEEEDNHVREAQSPDERTKVFMKIADRRLELITGTSPVPTEQVGSASKKDKKAQKKAQEKAEEMEKEWGKLPSLSRAELLRHYTLAIDECMAKLEDAYERNPKSTAFAKALSLLREATDRQLTTLRSLSTQVTDGAERRALAEAIDEAETANKGARSNPAQK
jgi:hypothetical protein